MISTFRLKCPNDKHLFADTVSATRDGYTKICHRLCEKHYQIEELYENILQGVFRRCWGAPCASPRWLGQAQRSTTASAADAVGVEERHIDARLWT